MTVYSLRGKRRRAAQMKTNTVMVIIFIKLVQAVRRGSRPVGTVGGIQHGVARRHDSSEEVR